MLVQAGKDDRERGIEVFAWLATPVQWFLAMGTQWRRDGDGRVAGLDYGAGKVTAELAGLDVGPDDFAHLQIIEQAVLEDLRNRRTRRPVGLRGMRP
ncbi:DUF1799 domain-containing protein [Roseovarius sp. MBR-6]|jgi:hypothetical protein|uniref:DUF1799 domain-containing protein n=1 Tax=Roseovarius sp. MBR-6 TaxID=3156459 RepID=UPI0033995340